MEEIIVNIIFYIVLGILLLGCFLTKDTDNTSLHDDPENI